MDSRERGDLCMKSMDALDLLSHVKFMMNSEHSFLLLKDFTADIVDIVLICIFVPDVPVMFFAYLLLFSLNMFSKPKFIVEN